MWEKLEGTALNGFVCNTAFRSSAVETHFILPNSDVHLLIDFPSTPFKCSFPSPD